MRIQLALTTLLVLTATEGLQAQCASSDRTDPLYAPDRIQLVASGFPSGLSSVVNTAMGKWNSASCNTEGNDFPYFQTTSTGASRVVNVTYRTGLNPDNDSSCGNFAGNQINIYSQARNPHNGLIVPCGTADRVAESLAHELGHLLGLSDQYGSACQGVIMSQVAMTSTGTILSRSVTPEECQKANDLSLTTVEQPPPPPPPDEDPYCDAYCWTSCVNNQCPQGHPGCPVLLDLNQGGIRLTGLDLPVLFDIDADGTPEIISWTEGGEGDALLALDRNGNGLIDDGSELFGNATLLSNGKRAANGYIALADFDKVDLGGNDDGQLSVEDAIYPGLLLWVDDNHNGVSESTELVALSEAGVTRINLAYTRSNRSDPHGNGLRFRGSAWRLGPGGSERSVPTWDVFFQIGD